MEEGQPYFVGAYHEKLKETSKYFFYKPASKLANVYIHPNEIISCNVDFDGQKMEKSEYISVCQEFYYTQLCSYFTPFCVPVSILQQ